MLENCASDLGKVRDAIYMATKDRPSPTVVGMARNAIMFLDTSYMWINSLQQLMAEMGQVEDKAVPSAGVVPVDFAQKN